MKTGMWKSSSGGPRPKVQQSIRGKISSPIPIPNLLDAEFTVRNPTTSVTEASGPGMNEPGIPPHPAQPPPPVPGEPPTVSPAASQIPVKRDSVHRMTSSNRSLGPRRASNSPRTRQIMSTAPVRESVISAVSQQTGRVSVDNAPQRKKSTLRGALSRLFGRRKRTGSHDSSASKLTPLGNNNLHRSDPTALHRTGRDEAPPKRSASLPITEFDRALRSHSIGPGDITAIESARNSVHLDASFARRRAATSTGELHGRPRFRELTEFTGLSPRPASVRGRHNAARSMDDPSEIGRAITSDAAGSRRRSRSLSGIRDLELKVGSRRRSDEIRYWRESYDPGFMSPISSNAPDGDDTGALSFDLAPATPVRETPKTPPQPFNFGNMNELAGMKITQAAGLETRINSLEARMQRLERVVTQLCNAAPGLGVVPNLPGHARQHSHSVDSTTYRENPDVHGLQNGDGSTQLSNIAVPRATSSRHSDASHMSFGEAPTFIGSIHQPPLQIPVLERPLSNTTIRGATSLPTLPREIIGPFTADHYTTLLALVETERSARMTLEAQVRRLNHSLNILSLSGTPPRGLLISNPPPTAGSFGAQSAFSQSSSDESEEVDAVSGNPLRASDGSAKALTLRPDDSGVVAVPHSPSEDEESDTFSAPLDVQPHVFGAFGEELRDEAGDGSRKKAARTLSLSQLTLGKRV